MNPYSFPPFHCCLSEKEVQLECLFDGEIGSVVSVHFSFFVSLRLFESPPPVLSSLLSFLVTFWAEKLEALSLTVYILSNLCWISIQHPFISSCISASKTIATPDKHQTHSSPFRIRLLMSKIRHVGFLTNIPNHHRTEGHSNHLKHQNTIIFPSSIIALCIVLSLFFI